MASRRTQRTVRRDDATSASESPPVWLTGPRWADQGFRQPGWRMLPLRGFLAVTFCYAGLQKLANPAYLDPHSPSSVLSQLRSLSGSSPIGPLLSLSAHAPTLVGLLIAVGELAVGVGALLGLWTRLAAAGGALLSLTFFLTVSWNTTPYYYGSDIVFLFAWLTVAGLGDGGVLSVNAWLDSVARRQTGLPATPASVALTVPRLRELCERGNTCAVAPNGTCGRFACPVFPSTEQLSAHQRATLDRRSLLLGVRTGAVVAAVAAVGAATTAIIGRLVGGTDPQASALGAHTSLKTPRHPTAAHHTRTGGKPPASGQPPPLPGTPIGAAAAVPVGRAAQFTDPASGAPAWVVQPSTGTFVAFSAVCTHAGCTVGFDSGSMEFVCPCHGGTFDASTGQVVAGPPPSPLPRVAVRVVNGELRVD